MANDTTVSDNPILDAAESMQRGGKKPIPMHRLIDGACTCGKEQCKGKHPAIEWGEFISRSPTPEEVARWFRDGRRNVAVVTGGGLAVVDFDDPALFDRLEKAGAFNGVTVAKTRRGFHVYLNESRPSRTGELAPGLRIDIKAEKGLVLVPPSLNDGHQYAWLRKGMPLKVENARDWITGKLAEAGVAVPPPKHGAIGKSPGWIGEALDDLADGNRNQTFTSVAGRLRREGLEAPDILALLLPHAERVGFPAEELNGIAKSVTRYEPKRRSVGRTDEEREPRVLTLKELFASCSSDTQWVVENIIPEQAIVCFAAPGGVGKTWLGMDLALAVAQGTKWLGQFAAKQATVLHIDAESAGRLLRRRYARLVAGRGIDNVEGLPLRLVLEHGFSLSTADGIETLRSLIRAHEPRLVILDPMVRFHDAEENSASEMAQVNKVLRDLVREFGVSILLADHVRKSKDDGWDGGLRGSSEKHAALDSLFSVRAQRAGSRLVVEHVKSRWDEAVPTFEVEIRDAPPEGVVTEWFAHEGEEGEEERQERTVIEMLSALAEPDGWARRTALIDDGAERKLSARAIDAALKRLCADGRVAREGRAGASGGKAAHFRLNPVASAAPAELSSSPLVSAPVTTTTGDGAPTDGPEESLSPSPCPTETTTTEAVQLSLLTPPASSSPSQTPKETTTTEDADDDDMRELERVLAARKERQPDTHF